CRGARRRAPPRATRHRRSRGAGLGKGFAMNNALLPMLDFSGLLQGNAAEPVPAENGLLQVDTQWLAALQAQMNPPAAAPVVSQALPLMPEHPELPMQAAASAGQLPEEWLQQVLAQVERQLPEIASQDAAEGLLAFIASPPQATQAATPESRLPSRLSPGFAEPFTGRVQWLAQKGVSEARIEINPREFGPIRIRIAGDANGIQVQFYAAHSQTRQALTVALPRLGEMFAASGMVLREARVLEEGERLEEISEEALLREGLLRREA